MKKLLALLIDTPLIPLAIITVIFGTIYVCGQQILRQDANDPQIQLAEDVAAAVNNNVSAGDLIGGGQIDVSKSLSPFMVAYNDLDKVVASTGMVDGKTPELPSGVFSQAKNHELRFTWQPKRGVRLATVVLRTNNGFVLAARNMREVEQREEHIEHLAAFGWLVSVAGLLVYWFAKIQLRSKKS